MGRLVVQKYGGSSVADPDRIRSVADHIARTRRRGDDVVVVVSAMGKETNDLLHLAGQVSRSRPGRELDMLITAGERKATALLCMALHDAGVEADSLTGSQAGFLTDATHTNARIVEVRPTRVCEALDAGRVPVVGGAQGMSPDRDITFLGRNGSDTTAVALAAALKADACELYTDVSGVYTADPRVVPDARRLPSVSFEELLEMTATGCPKPALRSVEFARRHGVALHVRSSFTWEPGTWVREEPADYRRQEGEDPVEQAVISAVTSDTSEAKVTIGGVPDSPGVAARLFRPLADRHVNVDMIVQNVSDHGKTDISFTVPGNDLDATLAACRVSADAVGADRVTADPAVAKVSLIGAGMRSHPGVSARMFEVLAEAGVNIEMISTSAIRITCVVRAADVEDAVVALHEAFELSHPVT